MDPPQWNAPLSASRVVGGADRVSTGLCRRTLRLPPVQTIAGSLRPIVVEDEKADSRRQIRLNSTDVDCANEAG